MEEERGDLMAYAPPIAVGVLLALYAAGMWLMSDGDANPAILLLVLLLAAGAVGYGLYRRERVRR